ncbi:MAG: protein translocase subunit SecD [Planctomycetota bacterium]|nr:protein translocase subunit SecD [Planctomycetota bacterium]MDA1113806.1 protein translocase subunit SecD [Planctomycetota bacterium]
MVHNLSRKLLGIAVVSLLSIWAIFSFDLHLGLDLRGGTRLVYSLDFDGAVERGEITEAERQQSQTLLDETVTIFAKRVDPTGVKDIPIYSQGEDSLIIELPDYTEEQVEEVKRLVGSQGLLQFRIIAENSDGLPLAAESQKWRDWKAANPEGTPLDFNRIAENEGGPRPEIRWFAPDSSEGSDAVTSLGQHIVDGAIPLLMLDQVRPELAGSDTSWEFSGGGLSYAGATTGNTGFPVVAFEFVKFRKKAFSDFTAEYKGRAMAIVLNNMVFSAPNINDRLPGGGIIEGGQGGFDMEQVSELVTVLKTGSLKIVPQIESETFVGSNLGHDAITTGAQSAAFGGILVLLFMLVYYRMNGVVACLSLGFNAFMLMGMIYFTQATMTLPGLAGLVLTIGMAVDANILIFERVREEWKRGRELPQAYKNGYDRAFLTIVDANVTTLIAGLVLYNVGTGPVQGFAATLCLGLLTTMFSALVFSKVIMNMIIFGKNPPQKVSMMKAFAEEKEFNFLGARKIAGIISIVLIMGGLFAYSSNYDKMLGIDFAGGATARVELAKKADITQVRGLLEGYEITEITGKNNSEDTQASFLVKRKLTPEQRAALASSDKAVSGGIDRDFAGVMVGELAVSLDSLLFHAEDGSVDLGKSFPEKSTVGARVSGEIKGAAFRAIMLSLLLIVVYMTFRFREYRYGFAAVAALFHDVLITLGALAVASATGLVHIEINLEIIAAFLTIIGYSLNDTIVVFDRIRENLPRRKEGFAEIINVSINQSLSRTILTSVTTFFVVGVLFFANRQYHNSLEGFSFAMLIGIIVGTYSSIFVASPLLVFLDRWARKRQMESISDSAKRLDEKKAAVPTA